MSVDEVLVGIARDEEMRSRFVDHLTINVTGLFRDADRWEVLEGLLRDVPGGPLRAWSAGCACGAEAVSLSITSLRAERTAWILATDIDATSLTRARAGRFGPVETRELPADIAAEHFQVVDEDITANADVLSRIRVRRHNLLDDDYPPGRYDVIACRNVLIYFSDAGRNAVHKRLVGRLTPGGILFTGSAERVRKPRDLGLEVIDSQFYRKAAA